MRRFYDNRSNNEYGSEKSSLDYLAHVTRLAKTPSVLTDVPYYGNTRRMFDNTRNTYEGYYEDDRQRLGYGNQNKPQFNANEKGEVVEYRSTNNVNTEVCEETEDVGAGSNQRRNRGFGLCKWKTFDKN